MSVGVLFPRLTNWLDVRTQTGRQSPAAPSPPPAAPQDARPWPASPGGDTSGPCHTRSSGSRRCPGWTASPSGLSWRNWGSTEGPVSQLGRRADPREEARLGARKQPLHRPRSCPGFTPGYPPQVDRGRPRRLEGESLGSSLGYWSLYKMSYLQDSIASFSPLSDPTKTRR